MKKFMLFGFSILAIVLIFIKCDQINNNLSDDEIIKGLKTALEVGTDSSVRSTSANNGYYNNKKIKIILPPEYSVITNSIETIKSLGVDLTPLVENVVISMNRAAESTAKQAAPIFKNSITSLTISDGLQILNGTNPASNVKSVSSFDSTAATNYLKSTTYNNLVDIYQNPINIELDKDLGLGFSSNQAWNTLTTSYNTIANSLPGKLAGLSPVTGTLGQYVTKQALNGLFIMVGEQEVKIRQNPWKWMTTTVGGILTKVFGR